MAKGQTVNLLSGSMNVDKDIRYINPQTEYPYAKNFRNNNTTDSSSGVGGNILGNDLKRIGAVGETVIGSCYYEKKKATVFFIYETTGQHKIEMYLDGVSTVLLQATFLNFSLDNYIYNPVISNDDLIWTDGLNEPRILNLERALNRAELLIRREYTVNGQQMMVQPTSIILDEYEFVENRDSEGYYTCIIKDGSFWAYYFDGSTTQHSQLYDTQAVYREIVEYTIVLIASPPSNLTSLFAEYVTTTNIGHNTLLKNQYKFVQKYKYLDGRESVWGNVSILPQPSYNEDVFGNVINKDNNNAISIKFGLDRRDLSKIYLGVIKNNENGIYIFETINIYKNDGSINNDNKKLSELRFDGGLIEYKYFEDSSFYIKEDNSTYSRLFDYVPPKATHLELANERLIMGDIESGFNLPEPDTVIELDSSLIKLNGDDFTANPAEVIVGARTYENFSTEIRGATLTFNVTVVFNGTTKLNKNYSILHSADISLYGFMNRVSDIINYDIRALNLFVTDRFSYGHGVSPIEYLSFINTQTYTGGVLTVSMSSIVYKINSKQSGVKTLKSNSKYVLGIKYLDKFFRESGVIVLGEFSTPPVGGVGTSWTIGQYYKIKIKNTINHKPPENAVYYVYCITKNRSISSYEFSDLINAPSITSSSYGSVVNLDFNEQIEDQISFNNNYQAQSWTFEKGDRIRGIGNFGVDANTEMSTYETLFDVEILSQDETTKHFIVPEVLVSGSNVITAETVVEIYRPTKISSVDNSTFFEISDLLPIINGYHIANTQAQTSLLPAINILDFGDTYLIYRGFYDKTNINIFRYCIIESNSISDYFTNKSTNYGRVGFVIEDMKLKRYPTMLQYGGVKNSLTTSNYIAHFSYEDTEYLEEQNGSIHGIIFSGRNISVYQNTKKTTFYYMTSTLSQANGTQMFAVSDKVLNNKYVSEYDYGTINPESVIKVNNYVYFFDANNGLFIRDAENGLFPISDYGINSFSKKLGKAVIDGGIKVYAGYDEYNREVVYAWNGFVDNDKYTNAITFIEGGNQFKSFYEHFKVANSTKYFVSLFGVYRNKLVTFIDGDMWINDDTEIGTYNTLYGRNVDTEIQVVCNNDILQNKVFDYITIESDSEWKANQQGDVSIDYDRQKSMIPLVKKKEENYVSAFGRDILSKIAVPTGFDPTMYKFVNGSVLRGKFALIKLRYQNSLENESKKAKILGVIINNTISERI